MIRDAEQAVPRRRYTARPSRGTIFQNPLDGCCRKERSLASVCHRGICLGHLCATNCRAPLGKSCMTSLLQPNV